MPGISLMILSPRMPKSSHQRAYSELHTTELPRQEQVPEVIGFQEPEIKTLDTDLGKTVDYELPYETYRKSRRVHVLDKFAAQLSGHLTHALKNVVYAEDTYSRVAGVVVSAKEVKSRSGLMLTGYLGDPSGNAEFILFADKYAMYPIKEGDIVYAVCKLQGGKLIVNNLDLLGKKRIRTPKKRGETYEAREEAV